MKTTMISKERMLAAIKRQPTDHIPLGQLFHSNILGTPPDKKWRNQFERSKIMKEIGIDPVIDIWLPTPVPPPDVKVRHWNENDPASPYPLLCAEYETPAGKLVEKVVKTPDWYHPTHYQFLNDWEGNVYRSKDQFDKIDMLDDWFTRRFKVPLVRGSGDLDAFEYILKVPSGKAKDDWIRNAIVAKDIAEDLGLITQARRVALGDWFMWVCLIEDFCCAMVQDPCYVKRFYGIIHKYNLDIIDLVLEVEPDLIQYRGWYDTPDYWGKERHKEILVPGIQELAKKVHNGNSLFCYLLPEGYTHYKETLSELDVDVFLGLEPMAARKSENLAAVKEAIGRNSCIWGGVNACVTVGMGSDEEIDNAVKTAIETLGPQGFILNASIYFYDDDAAWDRIMKFFECWRKYA